MIRQAARALVWLLAAGAAQADVFVFGPEPTSEGQYISALSGSSASSPQGPVAISGNAVAVDTSANRLYFAEPSGTGSRINRLSYTSSSSWVSILELPTFQVTHLAFDPAPTPRLLVAARRNLDGATVLFPVVLSSQTLGGGFELPDDLTLGASVFRTGDDRWFFTSGAAPQRLIAMQMNAGTVTRWDVPGGFRLGALALQSTTQTLWGIVDDAAQGGARLAEVIPAASLTLDARGTADPACCFVLAGPSVIDPTANRLYTITRGRAAVLPMRPVVVSFSLVDGSRVEEAEMSGNGLFSDVGVVFQELFSDGFE